MLEPLAALAAQPIRGGCARARRDVERGIVNVAAVVQRRIPLVAGPVLFQALLPEQQSRVIKLIRQVVEAAANVERCLARNQPYRIAGDAQTVTVATG